MLNYSNSQNSLLVRPSQPDSPVHPYPRLLTETPEVAFFPAGSEVYAQGEKAGNYYQVEFGAVRVYRLLSDGRRQINAFYIAGEMFGFEADPAHHFFAESIIGTGIRTFRPAPGLDFSRELLPLAVRGMTRALQHQLVLGRQTAVERVAAFLVDMAERQGGLRQVELPMSRQDIGDYLGLTIETVSRVFSKLRQKGTIRLPSLRTVEIAKWQALQDLTE
jgi:CRP/FNR family nitrogen fixation transcriptional regulator